MLRRLLDHQQPIALDSTRSSLFKHLTRLREDSAYRYEKQRVLVSGLNAVVESPATLWSAPDRAYFPKRVLLSHTLYDKLMGVEIDSTSVEEQRIQKLKLYLERCLNAQSNDFPDIVRMSKVTSRYVLDNEHDAVAAEFCMPPLVTDEAGLSSLKSLRPPLRRMLILDSLRDPGNVGTLIRSAVAFGWDAIFWSDAGTVDPFHAAVLRAATGKVLHVPILRGNAAFLAHVLQACGLQPWLAASSPAELTLPCRSLDQLLEVDMSDHMALMLTSEAHGSKDARLLDALLQNHRTKIVHIPMAGCTESLNVAVAGSILLHSLASPSPSC